MTIPIRKFAPKHNFDLRHIRRSCCLAYIKVQRNSYTKFGFTDRRVILVSYTRTGYILLRPEEEKLCGSRDVKFNEKLVFGDKYRKDSMQNWQNIFDETNRNECNVQYENKKIK